MIWSTRDVATAFERRGYQRIPTVGLRFPDASWYRSPSSTVEAEQYVVLTPQKSGTTYNVRVGFNCPAATVILEEARPEISKMAGLTTHVITGGYCSSTFDPGRMLRWPLFAIPNPLEPSRGAQQFTDLTRLFLEPIVETAVTADAVLERLLRVEVPFDWGATNAFFRTAEVISISMVLNRDIAVMHRQLAGYQNRLQANLRRGTKWAAALDALINRVAIAAENVRGRT